VVNNLSFTPGALCTVTLKELGRKWSWHISWSSDGIFLKGLWGSMEVLAQGTKALSTA